MKSRAEKRFLNKRGNQFVEAGIALPVVILSVMLLLRLFTFYLEILTSGISSHEDAWNDVREYDGLLIRKTESNEEISMLQGGLLKSILVKNIKTEAYLIDEDEIVKMCESQNRE